MILVIEDFQLQTLVSLNVCEVWNTMNIFAKSEYYHAFISYLADLSLQVSLLDFSFLIVLNILSIGILCLTHVDCKKGAIVSVLSVRESDFDHI